jgi:hypothetical protein
VLQGLCLESALEARHHNAEEALQMHAHVDWTKASQLESMGYAPDAVACALSMFDNSVERAVDWLISSADAEVRPLKRTAPPAPNSAPPAPSPSLAARTRSMPALNELMQVSSHATALISGPSVPAPSPVPPPRAPPAPPAVAAPRSAAPAPRAVAGRGEEALPWPLPPQHAAAAAAVSASSSGSVSPGVQSAQVAAVMPMKGGWEVQEGALESEDTEAKTVMRMKGLTFEWRYWHHNHWRQYDVDVSRRLEEALVAGLRSVQLDLVTDSEVASDKGCKYEISLTPGDFQQTNLVTGFERPVKRALGADFALPPWIHQTVCEENNVNICLPTTQPVVANYLRKKVAVEDDEKASLRRQLESLTVTTTVSEYSNPATNQAKFLKSTIFVNLL